MPLSKDGAIALKLKINNQNASVEAVWLMTLRYKLNMSQNELGASIGASGSYIGLIESGTKENPRKISKSMNDLIFNATGESIAKDIIQYQFGANKGCHHGHHVSKKQVIEENAIDTFNRAMEIIKELKTKTMSELNKLGEEKTRIIDRMDILKKRYDEIEGILCGTIPLGTVNNDLFKD